jgi:glycosyltransferase involved in cell wall biosynthesis
MAVILIEPNPFASRLHVLASMAESLRGEDVAVVIPDVPAGGHWDEMVPAFDDAMQCRVEGDAPTHARGDRLTPSQLLRYVRLAHTHARSKRTPQTVVFTALDDYLIAFVVLAPLIRILFRRHRLKVVKYRVQFLSGSLAPRDLRGYVLSMATRWSVRATGASLVVFDERFAGMRVGGHHVDVLPDPWFGEFSPDHRDRSRAALKASGDEFVALTIGKQDFRKGIGTLMTACARALEEAPRLALYIVGRIDSDYTPSVAALMSRWPDRVHHEASFVPEVALPDYFCSADVVVMPYARLFTSTSGVLARAAASGVPVVASDHGLIGHRVSAYGLGVTFASGDASALSQAMVAAASDPQWRDRYTEGLARFADETSLASFGRQVRQIFSGSPSHVARSP